MNRLSRWMVNRGAGRRARRLLARLEGHLPIRPGSAILELGAGRGALSALLLERFRPRRAVVTDYDPRQVEAARAFLGSRPAGIPEGVELRTADALQLPFPDRAFDAVFAIAMLHHVDASPREYRQRPTALAEIRRVLAPGGLLVYSDFSKVPELRQSLHGLGMVREYSRPGWFGRELAVYRRPFDPAGG
ncbi:MAG TPA: class I SAM-dependent methyltransferase [Thermoplasmata archaeon]|nr:class I SAM-dependent methyltransferase [Thermoplasmata archaeon]